jgi:signal transduction histidine kinase/CheY-like chemotaxis protein
MTNVEKLLNIYNNNCNIEDLCKELQVSLSSEIIVLCWYYKEKLWYIPGFMKRGILYDNSTNGWIIRNVIIEEKISEISQYNFINYSELCFERAYVILDSNEKPDMQYLTILNMILEILRDKFLLNCNRKRESMMLSYVCHSIRNPLNGLLNMSNMMLDLKKQEESIYYLNRASIDLANNIFDIIDLTQLEIERIKIHKESFNIRQLLEEIVDYSLDLCQESNVKFVHYISNIVPEIIYSDRRRLKQILLHIIKNAFKYTKEGEISLFIDSIPVDGEYESGNDSISLNTAPEKTIENAMKYYNKKDKRHRSSGKQHSISFIIKDTGIGINSKKSNEIFIPNEISTYNKRGIGLRISYLLAQKIGGNLYLTESIPGKGTCFTLELIVCEDETNNTYAALKNKNILIIDQTSIRTEIAQISEQYHMNYRIAYSYEEAIFLYAKKTFDIIIYGCSDNYKENMHIYQVLKQHWVQSSIITLSNYSNRNLKAVYDEVLYLPFESHIYLDKMLNLISGIHTDNKIDIIVVDDDKVNRIVIEKLLRSHKYSEITLAGSGEKCLDILGKNPNIYEVAIVDIRMPYMNGFELAKKIRTHHRYLKIICITADILSDSDPIYLFDKVIYKPINIDILNKAIHDVVKR